MTSKYVAQPLRTVREAEADKLCLDLKHDHRFDGTDGYLHSAERSLEYAIICARRLTANIPMHEGAWNNASDLVQAISDLMADHFKPAEESAREYFDREDVG